MPQLRCGITTTLVEAFAKKPLLDFLKKFVGDIRTNHWRISHAISVHHSG